MNPSIVLLRATAIPGTPGRVVLVIGNQGDARAEIVRSIFELKRAYPGSPHALPRASWGYPVTSVIVEGTVLDARAELWSSFDGDIHTTFGGGISAEAPAPDGAQSYLAGRVLYRRARGELFETAFYRRLSYPDLSFRVIDAHDHALNYCGRIVVASEFDDDAP
ncbi:MULTISPECIES: hypothetical protein [unclassified Caballeronia]|uniref:hypothetical protein n=1 Tax=unclassified Caballeronia TaxID=2646786 RepID=UPI00285E2477|nr:MULTISPECIES: hypothetical protein [unclassified Caballeronia]MDR5741462.1 hypothetical protein [Caballeronia sp. LZ016]MDR5806775.1 hypothetical protein [Caballeronia sp. LZ019]